MDEEQRIEHHVERIVVAALDYWDRIEDDIADDVMRRVIVCLGTEVTALDEVRQKRR